jgi:arginyl-tRNA synthetase
MHGGASDTTRKQVIIEFSSPNIASEFQGKHLRSTLLGAQLVNLYVAMGWNVTKINYLGDWGKPIGLLGAGFEKIGSQELLEADPVAHLHDVYQKTFELFLPEQVESRKARDEYGDAAARDVESKGLFAERNAFFKRMEDGDQKALDFAKRFRNVSVKQYIKLYARLNVSFDEYSGESQVSPDTMAEVLQIMKDKDLVEESGGALTINLKNHGGKHGTAIIKTREGSTTYLLREIAAVLERHRKYSFDKMIYVVVADSHNTHFYRLFKILELMGLKDISDKLQHVSFSDGTQIPKAADNHEQTLADVLYQCEASMQKAVEEDPQKLQQLQSVSSAELCTSAFFAHVSSVKNAVGLTFDAEKLASFEPTTGPDLVAWYTSLSAIKERDPDLSDLSVDDTNTLFNEAHSNVLRLLIHYPEVVESAFKSSDPAIIMTYLASVVARLGLCIPDRINILPLTRTRDQLFEATRIVLENALRLLGIVARLVTTEYTQRLDIH